MAQAVVVRVGVVVVSHGETAAAMLASVRGLLGPAAVEGMEAIAVAPGEGRAEIQARIDAALHHQDQGRGVLLVCDLQGSTPANCCVELKRAEGRHEVLCGLSLPMLIKLASADRRALGPAELAHIAAETAVKSVRLGEGGQP